MRVAIALAILALTAAPAAAQEADDDWDVVVDPGQSQVTAVLAYEGGQGVVAVCRGGQLEAAVTGLPPAPEGVMRRLRVRVGGGAEEDLTWFNTTGGLNAFSPTPAGFIRSLRRGGVISVRAWDAGGAPHRLNMQLPGGHAGIDRVLAACGAPLEDARDDIPLYAPDVGPDASMFIVEPDYATAADAAPSHAGQVAASVSCIVMEGGALGDCRVEASAGSARLGPAMIEALGPARVVLPDDPAEAIGRRVVLANSYQTVVEYIGTIAR